MPMTKDKFNAFKSWVSNWGPSENEAAVYWFPEYSQDGMLNKRHLLLDLDRSISRGDTQELLLVTKFRCFNFRFAGVDLVFEIDPQEAHYWIKLVRGHSINEDEIEGDVIEVLQSEILSEETCQSEHESR